MSEPKKSKKVFRIQDIAKNAIGKRHEVYIKGDDCGFKTGDEYLSYRIGYTTGVYSYSAQGKTQFYIEQAVHLSKRYGRKHAIWLTESGKKEEMALDIAMTYMGKSLFGGNLPVTDEEIQEALEWMDRFFYIIDHENDMLNIRDIYGAVGEIEREYGIKIDCVAIDNASNLVREGDKSRLMTHEYMNYLITAINRTSLKMKYHTFILFHVQKTDKIECKDTKIKYQGCPDHYDISGGQQINFLSYNLVCVWRPISREEQVGIINPETGTPYELNESHIVITKSKPKGVGMQGKFVIYFDSARQKYYEIIDGHKFFAGEYELKFADVPEDMKPKSAIQPSSSWYEVDKEPELDFERPHNFIIRPSRMSDDDDNSPF